MSDTRKNKKRIVFYLNILRDGAGMINREIGYSRQLDKLDYKVSIISHFKPTRSNSDLNITIKTVWNTRYLNILYSNIFIYPLTLIKLFFLLLSMRPEVLFVDLFQEAWWALVFKPIFNYKIVFTYHGVADSKFYSGKKKFNLEKERYKTHKLLRKVDDVIIVSNFMRKEVEKIGVNATTIYNGVESIVHYESTNKMEPNPVAVFVGRFTEYKGAFNIIKAFNLVHSRLPEAKLKMYGYYESENYLKEINKYICENKLSEIIELNGAIEGIRFADTVCNSTLFVNGSTDETFGMPILEAQALGIPCVAFRAGGIPEIIINDKTGLMADENNIKMYANCIYKIMSDAQLRKNFSENAQINAEKFLYSNLVYQLIEVIERNP